MLWFFLLYNLSIRFYDFDSDDLESKLNLRKKGTFLLIYYLDKILHAYFIVGFFFSYAKYTLLYEPLPNGLE